MARIHFRDLCTTQVSHAFFGGPCDALRFVVPPATQAALAGLRAIAREREGRLHLLIETDDADQPIVDPIGAVLSFGLAPRDAGFDHYTVPPGVSSGESVVWDNAVNPAALGPPHGERIVDGATRVEPRSTARPLAMRLLDDAGAARATVMLNAADEAWALPVALPHGPWQIEETAAGPPSTWRLRVEPGLAGCWGLLQIRVDAAHLAAAPTFTLDFAARGDTLRYYVVASRFSDAEFDQLQVLDNGFTAEGRPQIEFDRLLPAAFGPSHLSPALLDPSGAARIALFQARAAVTRRARGPAGVELHRNGDVLIGHLPQPGADRRDAQFVVHLNLA
jgi:hypothetical protein